METIRYQREIHILSCEEGRHMRPYVTKYHV
jgi:hypothetical protein